MIPVVVTTTTPPTSVGQATRYRLSLGREATEVRSG
jgi:hypothetical protein